MITDDHEGLRDRACAFAEAEIAPSVGARDQEARWDHALFVRLGEAGLLGAGLPPEHGGGGLPARAVSELLDGFGEGSGDAGLALAWWAHSLGCALPILRFGTPDQRRRHLPALARGDRIGALAHGEIHAPGDPLGLRTTATRRGDRWVLRGAKSWVVNGPVADLLVVSALTDPDRGKDGVSAFLVERGAPGLLPAPAARTAGLRTATLAGIVLDGCEVPADNLLGPLGAGLTAVHRLVQRWERACLLAPWVGLQRLLLRRSIASARERCELGRALASSPLARAALADLRIRLELGLRLQRRAAAGLDHEGPRTDQDLAVARLFLGQSVALATREALRLQGPEALAGDRLAERLHRDAALLGLLGGSEDLLRSILGGSLLGLG